MSATPYVSSSKKVTKKKTKFPSGHWEMGEWVPHDEDARKIRKQLTNKATKKSLEAYVTLRKATRTKMNTGGQTFMTEPSAVGGGIGHGPEPPAPTPSQPPVQPVGNPEIRRMANDYVQKAGVAKHLPEQGYAPLLPEEHRKRVADAYEAAEHSPGDPDVQRAYAAFKHETKQQYEHAVQNGMTFTPWGANRDPYKTSYEMRNDVLHNKHLGFYQGGDMQADHPLAEVDPDHGLSYNDMFRATHDLYGHAKEGYEFGPRGEYNAFLAHKQMYSPVAQKAMRSETHGQNNWVNYGPHLRTKDGEVLKKGQPGWIHPNERPFAPQKATIMPDWIEGGQ